MFDINGFTKAAKSLGYTDEEISAVSAMGDSMSTPQFTPSGDMAADILSNQDNTSLVKDYYAAKTKTPTSPLKLTYDPNKSSIEQYQEALNSDFEQTGGARSSDIKDYYAPYVAEEKTQNIAKGKDQQTKLESAKVLDQTLTQLDELKDLSAKYGVMDIAKSKVGLSSADQIYNQKKALIAQTIAKLAEYGKMQGGRGLSDKDRDFYTEKIMNIGPIGLQGPKNEQFEALKRDVIRSAGFDPDKIMPKENLPSTGTVVMTGPDGKKWNVPAEKVEVFKQNGYK